MPKASDNLPAHDPMQRTGPATVRHAGARMQRGRPPVKIQLNLTAMIDVIFQLLILSAKKLLECLLTNSKL